MEQAEAMGYMSAEACNIFKNVILPCLLVMYAKRNFKESVVEKSAQFILGFLNYYEIKCHVCHEYVGWSIDDHVLIHTESNKELQS
jgi:hypothetical protein